MKTEPAMASRSGLEREQWRKLQNLVAAVVPANAFQRHKLNGLGTFVSVSDFQARCPFTTKAEIAGDQQAHPPYGTNLTFPLESYTRFHQTSGTSGSPLRWLDTPESWEALVDNWVEVFTASGATRRDRIYFAFSFGPFLGFWTAFTAGQRIGALCLPGGGLSSAARLRAILDNQVTLICCTPTYAIHLAETAAKELIDLGQSAVRRIIVAGEPGGSIPAVRKRIESLWPGARVFDHHGMTEVGPVTYECPAQPGRLHVIESAYLAEVIDPQTALPVSAGATGELVLTTLTRVGSPLLRYRTGDLVKPLQVTSNPCECGRHELALEGGIIGRTDDMLVVRGVNIYPSAVDEIIRALPEVTEYQAKIFRSGALSEISVLIEITPSTNQPVQIVRELERRLQTAFNLRIPVALAPTGSLPRFEMKAKRWVTA